jgi:hypothetical protein
MITKRVSSIVTVSRKRFHDRSGEGTDRRSVAPFKPFALISGSPTDSAKPSAAPSSRRRCVSALTNSNASRMSSMVQGQYTAQARRLLSQPGRRLIEAKMKGLTIEPRAVSTPSPVIDLMAALKRSLTQEPSAPEQRTAKRKRTKQAPDRRQPALLLPLTGDRKRNQRPSVDPAVTSIKKRSRGA